MTGAYLRVERDGKWQPIEVEHLTPEERRAQFMPRDKEEILRWMDMLCGEIAKIEPLLQELESDGIIGQMPAAPPVVPPADSPPSAPK